MSILRAYILERDTKKQVLKLDPVEVVQQLVHGQRILRYLTSDDTGVSRQILNTIPALAMWNGHEAALSVYLDIHLERIRDITQDLTGPFAKFIGDYRKLSKNQDGLAKSLWRAGASDYPMTNPIPKINYRVIESHRASWIADAPSNRLKYYPNTIDLSIEYIANLEV